MQEKGAKRAKRKYGAIKKNFVSVEEAEEEKKKNADLVEEKLKKINLIKSLKVETPWTTGSSDDDGTGYLYYRIQQAKKTRVETSKYNKILDYLDSLGIDQIDFSGMLKETKISKQSSTLFNKVQTMSFNQKSTQTSSLLMRRKLKDLAG